MLMLMLMLMPMGFSHSKFLPSKRKKKEVQLPCLRPGIPPKRVPTTLACLKVALFVPWTDLKFSLLRKAMFTYVIRNTLVTYTLNRVVFVYYSSAFNTTVPSKLFSILCDLGLDRSLCRWFYSFVTSRSQVVRLGHLILNTGHPHDDVLSLQLYML